MIIVIVIYLEILPKVLKITHNIQVCVDFVFDFSNFCFVYSIRLSDAGLTKKVI